MTLQQTLQANDRKTIELFDKLQDTSDQAVKTRENLFGDLSHELRLHADIEQKHLFPALRGNDQTKDLVADATKTNRELRAKIDEIEGLAKGDKSFLPRLAELRKLFDEQVRDERRQLLPAARKALSDEEAQALADKIEARRAKAEEDQRADAEAKREAAKAEAEASRTAAEGRQAASEAVDSAKDSARELGKSASAAVRNGAEAARATGERAAVEVSRTVSRVRDEVSDTASRVRDQAADTAQRARDKAEDTARRLRQEAEDTVAAYRETARERGRDVAAVGSALRNFNRAGAEVRTVLVNSIRRSGRDMLELGKHIGRNPREFGAAQRDYAAAATRNLIETTNEVLAIIRSASAAGRQPLEQRLRAAA